MPIWTANIKTKIAYTVNKKLQTYNQGTSKKECRKRMYYPFPMSQLATK